MKIAISAETAADLTKELIEKNDLHILPFTIHLGDKTEYDGEISIDEIFDYVNKTKVLPKTSAVNEYQYDEHFKKLLEDYDAVVHLCISSKVSSAYDNAVRSAKKFKNVYVIDTQTLCTGIALLVFYALDLVKQGDDPETIVKKVTERIPYVQVGTALKRLDYLYKGGRCSGLIYLGANLLKIRPLVVCQDGKLVVGKKYRGNYNRVIKNYLDDTYANYNNPDYTRAFVTYTTADPELIEMAKNFLIEKGFKEVYVTRAGCTVSCYTGEDCLSIAYINDGNH